MSSPSCRECERPVCLVSACLLGCPTRYDGKAKPAPFLPLDRFVVIPVCPEKLAGLPTPRPPQMLYGGDGFAVLDGKARVVNELGTDVTAAFLAGAEKTLALARFHGASLAMLKGRSPACGAGTIWMDGRVTRGFGVAAALLSRNGVTCLEVN